jgi:hypothetical protein
VVERLELRESGFLGIAEMTGRLDLQGSKIVEHPATLEVRLFGHSKIKILKTIAGHPGLLSNAKQLCRRYGREFVVEQLKFRPQLILGLLHVHGHGRLKCSLILKFLQENVIINYLPTIACLV